MKQKLEKLRDELKALLLKVHELITEQEDGNIKGEDLKKCYYREVNAKIRGIDPPPEKPTHGN
jgi:hypothetical protein